MLGKGPITGDTPTAGEGKPVDGQDGSGGGLGGQGAGPSGGLVAAPTDANLLEKPTVSGNSGSGVVGEAISVGRGGGKMRVIVGGSLSVSGKIIADGAKGEGETGGLGTGAGSGGSVYVTVGGDVNGEATGVISANGGTVILYGDR